MPTLRPPSFPPRKLPKTGPVPRFLHLLLAAIGLWVPILSHAAPDVASTPIPRPGLEKIRGRAEKDLLLKVVGDQAGIEFELDTRGTKGSVRALNANSSQLRYTPPAERTITRDAFLFRARRGQSYSPWENFQIALLDFGPKLQVPALLDFGTLRLGESKTLPLMLSNAGDAAAVEEISTQAPFQLDPPRTQVQVAPSQEVSIPVRVRAESVGKSSGEVSVGRGASFLTVKLHFEVPPWIATNPSFLVLEPDKSRVPDSPRRAEFRIQNPNPTMENFTLDSAGELQHPLNITLQPGESRTIEVSLLSSDPGPTKGKLVVKAPPAGSPPEIERIHVITWDAPALPALLNAQHKLSPDPRAFHSVLTLENRGGRSGTWSLTSSGPFLLDSAGSLQISLSPHQSREIPVREAPDKRSPESGSPSPGEIVITGPDGTSRVGLESRQGARISPPTPSASAPPPRSTPPKTGAPKDLVRLGPSPDPSGATAPPRRKPDIVNLSETEKFAETPGRSEGDREMVHKILSNIFIPIVPGIVIRDLTPTTATLILPFPSTPPKNHPLLFEGKLTAVGDSDTEMAWKPMQYDAPVRDEMGRLHYHIRGLEPNSSVTLRILGPMLQSGKRQPIHQQEFRTPPKSSVPFVRQAVLVSLLLAVGGVWFKIRRG